MKHRLLLGTIFAVLVVSGWGLYSYGGGLEEGLPEKPSDDSSNEAPPTKEEISPPGSPQENQNQQAVLDAILEELGDPSIVFGIDEGIRLDYASNPRVMNYEDGVLTLAYESHAKELQNFPGERGVVSTSEDGLNFSEGRSFAAGESKGKGLLLPDGTWRRYFANFDLTEFVSESSIDGGKTYREDAGSRYTFAEEGKSWIGVWSEWVDDEGGVHILFNNNIAEGDGEVILVSHLYSEPSNNGLDFEMTTEDVIGLTDEQGRTLYFRDPNSVVLSDGRIRLLVMYQEPGGVPPFKKAGTLYTFISDDGGRSFELEAEVVSYGDFEALEVWSLNDPKILQLEDGRFRIYVAALLPDETLGDDVDEKDRFKWVLVSLTSE